MTRMRVWLLTALVALALGLNFVLLSPRIAQSAEETVRARLAAATNEVREQLELRDARLNPRLEAESPDLIDALRPPADPTLPVPKPDEKALRAAAAAAQPTEPDLLIVATADGATYTRRGKPAVMTEDIKDLPLVKAALDGVTGTPSFAQFEGGLFRVQAARIPGSVGVVVTGLLIDDRFAAQLRAAADTDVTLFHDGQIVASSLAEDKRGEMAAWVKAPHPGYGVLPLRLVLFGSAFDGKLPRGASRFAVRAATLPLEGGVMAALTISAFPHFGWLARYQAYYGLAFLFFIAFGLVWGLLPGDKPKVIAVAPVELRPTTLPLPPQTPAIARVEPALPLAGEPGKPVAPTGVPWTAGEPAGWASPGSIKTPTELPREPQAPLALVPAPAAIEPFGMSSPNKTGEHEGLPPELVAAIKSAPAPMLAIAAPFLGEAAHAPAAPDAKAGSGEATARPEHQPFSFDDLDNVSSIFSGLDEPAPSSSAHAPPVAPTEDDREPALFPPAPAHEALSSAPAANDPSPFDHSASSFAHLAQPFDEASEHAREVTESSLAHDSAPFNRDPSSALDVADLGSPSAHPAPPVPEASGDDDESVHPMLHDAAGAAPNGDFPATNPVFSFAHLLEQAHESQGSRDEQDAPDTTKITPSFPEDDDAHFPGDEPTRVEAPSAALLDKLREKDEPEPQPWHSAINESEAEHAAEAHAHDQQTIDRADALEMVARTHGDQPPPPPEPDFGDEAPAQDEAPLHAEASEHASGQAQDSHGHPHAHEEDLEQGHTPLEGSRALDEPQQHADGARLADASDEDTQPAFAYEQPAPREEAAAEAHAHAGHQPTPQAPIADTDAEGEPVHATDDVQEVEEVEEQPPSPPLDLAQESEPVRDPDAPAEPHAGYDAEPHAGYDAEPHAGYDAEPHHARDGDTLHDALPPAEPEAAHESQAGYEAQGGYEAEVAPESNGASEAEPAYAAEPPHDPALEHAEPEHPAQQHEQAGLAAASFEEEPQHALPPELAAAEQEHEQASGHEQAPEHEQAAEPEQTSEYEHPIEQAEHTQESSPLQAEWARSYGQPTHLSAAPSPTEDEFGDDYQPPPPVDPDEGHFEETYRQFIEMRHHTGEPADKVSYDKFVAKLRKNREELLAKHNARGVRFSVYNKDGRAAIKASAIR